MRAPLQRPPAAAAAPQPTRAPRHQRRRRDSRRCPARGRRPRTQRAPEPPGPAGPAPPTRRRRRRRFLCPPAPLLSGLTAAGTTGNPPGTRGGSRTAESPAREECARRRPRSGCSSFARRATGVVRCALAPPPPTHKHTVRSRRTRRPGSPRTTARSPPPPPARSAPGHPGLRPRGTARRGQPAARARTLPTRRRCTLWDIMNIITRCAGPSAGDPAHTAQRSSRVAPHGRPTAHAHTCTHTQITCAVNLDPGVVCPHANRPQIVIRRVEVVNVQNHVLRVAPPPERRHGGVAPSLSTPSLSFSGCVTSQSCFCANS